MNRPFFVLAKSTRLPSSRKFDKGSPNFQQELIEAASVHNLMTVLCTDAAYASEIDAAQAREAIREAEEVLNKLSSNDAGFDDAQNTLRLAQVRLDVASGS